MRSKERLEKTMMIPSRSMESLDSYSHYELISKCEGSRGTLVAQIWVQDLSILTHPNMTKADEKNQEKERNVNKC